MIFAPAKSPVTKTFFNNQVDLDRAAVKPSHIPAVDHVAEKVKPRRFST